MAFYPDNRSTPPDSLHGHGRHAPDTLPIPEEDKVDAKLSSSNIAGATYDTDPEKVPQTHEGQAELGVYDAEINDNLKLVNPLKAFTREQVIQRARYFATDLAQFRNDPALVQTFVKAALVAWSSTGASSGSGGAEDAQENAKISEDERTHFAFEDIPELDDEDRKVLRREIRNKWQQPKTLYALVVCCSLAAVVQGMDQSVISGANLFWPATFGISEETDRNEWLKGIVNSAPYFSCALLASWFTAPLNRYFGRRGTIFITCSIAFITCLWAAFTNSWWHLLISRVFLGFGIGPKSSTVPVYAAESTPPAIRGGLVMQWQLWTAFGIMLGYVADMAFYPIPDRSGIDGLNWRIMLSSAGIPALVVMSLVFLNPESPRWYLMKERYADAYTAFSRLRSTPLQAARETYLAYESLEAEKEVEVRNRGARSHQRTPSMFELFSTPRIRKGLATATFVMFMQQFCGINVVAYFGSVIFSQAGASQLAALGASLGFGALNFLFGIPGIFTIDTFGRRNLLLVGFPAMSAALFFTAFSFLIEQDDPTSKARVACVAIGIYLHCIAYSPTEGPIPFTMSAESFPLAVRDSGMSWATSVCWFFNGVLSLTWPSLVRAWGSTGAFCWYAAWNVFGLVYTYFFLPETRALSLEELDSVFSVSHREHASYHMRHLPYFTKKALFCGSAARQQLQAPEPLYEHEKLSLEERRKRGTMAPKAVGH
ncbi:hypothetical protein K437DRAFT_32084 [Tilletiaria anomala UBC 951]|uniref:Major facilitator superfamily (MFS) profile domain-containing protein n=1 Tax=Tilletiaria anomala (strain ATCC 24038 / CBS 436.72 / UBC 951) TaxID=1037660 RepID=A0A066VH82_TILAU|nr:uncharacterized protein K437DRAFT_32084 [Tilletiaria anomala UBC 951]KDN37915.1 hypothetical protein K437DRAFT_32084 [Tilletiaria anomala UBC 951]